MRLDTPAAPVDTNVKIGLATRALLGQLVLAHVPRDVAEAGGGGGEGGEGY
jgi:hypothetical protein